jgi:hypothetical protein
VWVRGRGALGPPAVQPRRRHQTTIHVIETEKFDLSLPLAFKIARAFGRTIEDVFDPDVL